MMDARTGYRVKAQETAGVPPPIRRSRTKRQLAALRSICTSSQKQRRRSFGVRLGFVERPKAIERFVEIEISAEKLAIVVTAAVCGKGFGCRPWLIRRDHSRSPIQFQVEKNQSQQTFSAHLHTTRTQLSKPF